MSHTHMRASGRCECGATVQGSGVRAGSPTLRGIRGRTSSADGFFSRATRFAGSPARLARNIKIGLGILNSYSAPLKRQLHERTAHLFLNLWCLGPLSRIAFCRLPSPESRAGRQMNSAGPTRCSSRLRSPAPRHRPPRSGRSGTRKWWFEVVV